MRCWGGTSGSTAPEYSSLAGIDDYGDHLTASIERGTTPNGVFGAKVMWGHLPDFAALAGSDPAALFDSGPTYVWVCRADTVHQAMSLWRALQSQAWGATTSAGPATHPVYRSGRRSTRRPAGRRRPRLDRVLRSSVTPLALTYEQIDVDPPGGRGFAVRWGCRPGRAAPCADDRGPASDARSEEWVPAYGRD